MTFYEKLGVNPDATEEEIQQAYRRKAAASHPDNQETGDADEFRALTLARDTLMDENSRTIYDQTGLSPLEKPELPAAIQLVRQAAVECAKQGTSGNLVDSIREMLTQNLAANQKAARQHQDMMDEVERRWADDQIKGHILAEFVRRRQSFEGQVLVSKAAIDLLKDSKYHGVDRPDTLASLFGGSSFVIR